MTTSLTFTVTDADTALAVGSGSLPVLGTPVLIAWCEAATCAELAAELSPGTTSVGVDVRLSHQAASAVGASIEVSATLTRTEGRLRHFEVIARGPDGAQVGQGEITRAVVEVDRFMARLER